MPSRKDVLDCMCQTDDSSVPLYDVRRTRECGEWPPVDEGTSVQRQHTTPVVLCRLYELAAQWALTGSTRHRQVNNQSAVTAETRVHA